MSVAEFSEALKNKAINEWFNLEKSAGGSASKLAQEKYKKDNINNIIYATSDYRKTEQTAEKTSFIITKDTIRQLITDFHGVDSEDPSLDDQVNIYFSAFRSNIGGIKLNRRKITIEGVDSIYFPTISFDSITNLVNNIMNLKPSELKTKYEKGHVVGLNTELLQVTRNRLSGVNTTGSTGKAKLLQELDKVIAYYKRLDLASANIQPAEKVPVYASINKSISKTGITKYLVEIQPREENQSSAREVQATIQGIRKLFTPAGLSEKALETIIDNISKSVTDPKFKQDLLDLRSSPNIKDMVKSHIESIILGNPISQDYSHSNVKVAEYKGKSKNLKNINDAAKQQILELTTLVKKLSKKVPTKQVAADPRTNLTNLQALLDRHLQHVVSANMGLGNDKRVLNYRTGRFAASAKVERLTQSKEGMITAFYTYMKNPYATFSEGGDQQYPKSRDPKSLISGSIKEIAATIVGNRLRAVVV